MHFSFRYSYSIFDIIDDDGKRKEERSPVSPTPTQTVCISVLFLFLSFSMCLPYKFYHLWAGGELAVSALSVVYLYSPLCGLSVEYQISWDLDMLS